MSAPREEGGGPRLSGRRLSAVALFSAVLLSVAAVLIGEIITGGEQEGARNCVIQGRTLLRPLQPAEQPGKSSRTPVVATVSVASFNTGRTVAATQSNSQGRFRIRVAAGSYVVTAWLQTSTPSSRSPVPARVTATPGEPVKLVLLFDSDIEAVGSPLP